MHTYIHNMLGGCKPRDAFIGKDWAVTFIPIPLPNKALQTSYYTNFVLRACSTNCLRHGHGHVSLFLSFSLSIYRERDRERDIHTYICYTYIYICIEREISIYTYDMNVAAQGHPGRPEIQAGVVPDARQRVLRGDYII